MIVVFPTPVLARLEHLERSEGIPPSEVVIQAVDIYSHLDADERHRMGMFAMGIVVDRHRRLQGDRR
ncbi:hypothetical protein [Aureimonas sp. AU20]|uniref:hypothetical protein n=1 Tax=Aureimonas sp. AU20 TaxID=1349819 RepID=UPI00071F9DF3|nr:hypothetical protein [Aureimonas sp. AU20]ALN73098.1 hypothetical protein M673_10220 [Aureimonas sp. AU20]